MQNIEFQTQENKMQFSYKTKELFIKIFVSLDVISEIKYFKVKFLKKEFCASCSYFTN